MQNEQMPNYLGVPVHHLLGSLFITTILTIIFFYPAIENFGKVLIGTEDIQFFIWLFWHYEEALASGTNPFYANEIFYPTGTSLTMSTMTPFQAAIYLVLPNIWSAFGRITFLQILSFVLGGLFSFALVYKFTKSFWPALAGSFIYNFSAFHFEKALHHLNYSMAFAFVPLFFIFYFNFIEDIKKRSNLILLSASLLIVALNELTVAIMIGFVVFLDIFKRYSEYSNKQIFTTRNIVALGLIFLLSILTYELLTAIPVVPKLVVNTVPQTMFIFSFIFIVFGKNDFVKTEKIYGYVQKTFICAIPILIYLIILAMQSSYGYGTDSILFNTWIYTSQIEYTVIPSEIQLLSHVGIFQGLPLKTEHGSYLGIVLILLGIGSITIKGASKEERSFMNFTLILLLFAFPLIKFYDTIYGIIPFISQAIFPLLSLLRVSSRFLIFVLLFLSIAISIFILRISSKLGT